jgi:hypothetical protein
LYAFPGFVLRLNVWDLVGTVSYTLAFALFESLVLLVPFVLLAVLLPARFFKARFIALSSIIIIISSLWMMYANYYRIDFTGWDMTEALKNLSLYALSLAIPIALVIRNPRLEQIVQALIQRVAVLAYVYVALGCIGVIIVFIRNL